MMFRHLKPGDKVTRMLAGEIPMEVEVVRFTDDGLIECMPPGIRWDEGWTFNPDTGMEVDERFSFTVSFLVLPKEGRA